MVTQPNTDIERLGFETLIAGAVDLLSKPDDAYPDVDFAHILDLRELVSRFSPAEPNQNGNLAHSDKSHTVHIVNPDSASLTRIDYPKLGAITIPSAIINKTDYLNSGTLRHIYNGRCYRSIYQDVGDVVVVSAGSTEPNVTLLHEAQHVLQKFAVSAQTSNGKKDLSVRFTDEASQSGLLTTERSKMPTSTTLSAQILEFDAYWLSTAISRLTTEPKRANLIHHGERVTWFAVHSLRLFRAAYGSNMDTLEEVFAALLPKPATNFSTYLTTANS
jgi:hypothetical protein